jgi:hypothetical protein
MSQRQSFQPLPPSSVILWNPQAMAPSEEVTWATPEPYVITNETKEKVRDADPNKGRCLVTNFLCLRSIEYSPCLPWRLSQETEIVRVLSTNIYSGLKYYICLAQSP